MKRVDPPASWAFFGLLIEPVWDGHSHWLRVEARWVQGWFMVSSVLVWGVQRRLSLGGYSALLRIVGAAPRRSRVEGVVLSNLHLPLYQVLQT